MGGMGGNVEGPWGRSARGELVGPFARGREGGDSTIDKKTVI